MNLFLNRIRISKLTALAVLAVSPVVALAQYPGALAPPKELAESFNSITVSQAQEYLNFLAGPECEGRGTGQEGYFVAARYVAAQFESFGLKPIGDNDTYFQGVPFTSSAPDPATTALNGPSGPIKLGQGISVANARGNFSLDPTQTIFVNMSSPATELPDSVDVDGKVVILTIAESSRTISRMFTRAGAEMLIVVVDEIGNSQGSFGRGAGNVRNTNTAPSVSLARKYAKMLARSMGVTPEIVDLESSDGEEIVAEEATGQVSFKVTVKAEEVLVPNVIGYLEGSDPSLKTQYVGVGAHLDHMGINANGVVYPGADDDGSGTTAMLLVAKAISESAVKPKRSIVFMAFCGEEMGLVGSRYYTENPIISLDDMNCLLQMDMVGRNEETADESADDNIDTIHLIGSNRISTELHEITLEANKHIGFKFEYDQESVYGRSDHANFARKGVPITFLFSGFHPDYHRPTDTVDKINFEKIVSSAKLNYLVLQKVASLPRMVIRDVDGG